MHLLRERAVAENRAGRPAEAARLLSDALSALDGLEQHPRTRSGRTRRAELTARVNTLVTLSLTEFLLAGLPGALARLDEADALADQLEEPGLRSRIAFQRAGIHGRAGDVAAARADFELVMKRLDAFTDSERVSVLLTRGMLALQAVEPAEATDSFAEAARHAHELGLLDQEFMARHNEGYAAYLLGDLPRALAVMESAEALGGSVPRGQARIDRAVVLLEAGLYREALEVLQTARDGVGGAGHDQTRAEADLELAHAHRLLGHLDEATEFAGRARAAYEELGATAWAARGRLVQLATELDRRRARAGLSPHGGRAPSEPLSVQAVADLADGLCDTATGLGDDALADSARLVAAEALLLSGDPATARATLDGRRRRVPGSLSEDLAGSAVLASVLVAQGAEPAARRVLSGAARRLSAGQQGSASLDLRTARAVHGVRLADLDLDLALPRGSGAVITALERWRSATDRLPSLGRPGDDVLAQLAESLRALRGRARRDADSAEQEELLRRAALVERQIRARDWTLGSQGTKAGTGLARQLAEGRAVLRTLDLDHIWFFAHGDRLGAVGIIGGRASVRDLMPRARAVELAKRVRSDLRAASTRTLGPLSGSVWGSLNACAAELDAALIRPWRVRGRGLVITTCEDVSALPWATFPSLAGVPLTIARSLTSFASRGQRPRLPGRPAVHISVGPAVARAHEEAAAVAGAWDGCDVTVEEPSSSASLVQALTSPGVIHVAAHGSHQPESPLFSSVDLHDGPVFAHELQSRGVRADHVVLSACEVGTATRRPGDETLGLAASMLSLGAGSVVAAVSPVPDDVAFDVMRRHHAALAAGTGSDEALASAIAASDPLAAAFLNLGGRWAPPGR